MPAQALQLIREDAAATLAAMAAYEKRRPAWTRTDTMRWLNARSAGVLAWVRRMAPEQAPEHSASMGRWLKDSQTPRFERAHARLLAPDRDETRRSKMTLPEVLG